MATETPIIQPNADAIRKRYETLVNLYVDEFSTGLGEKYSEYLYLSKELLHCAVNATLMTLPNTRPMPALNLQTATSRGLSL